MLGNRRMKLSVMARPLKGNCFILENGSFPVTSPAFSRDHEGFAAQFPTRFHLPLEDDRHPVGGVALARIEIAGFKMQFFRLTEEPGDLVVRQSFKSWDTTQQFQCVGHLYLAQVLMDELNRYRSFANSGRHSFDGAMPHISDGEYSGHIRFQQEGIALEGPAFGMLPALHHVGTSQHESAFVALDGTREPVRSRQRANKDKHRAGRYALDLIGVGAQDRNFLQVRVAVHLGRRRRASTAECWESP